MPIEFAKRIINRYHGQVVRVSDVKPVYDKSVNHNTHMIEIELHFPIVKDLLDYKSNLGADGPAVNKKGVSVISLAEPETHHLQLALTHSDPKELWKLHRYLKENIIH